MLAPGVSSALIRCRRAELQDGRSRRPQLQALQHGVVLLWFAGFPCPPLVSCSTGSARGLSCCSAAAAVRKCPAVNGDSLVSGPTILPGSAHPPGTRGQEAARPVPGSLWLWGHLQQSVQADEPRLPVLQLPAPSRYSAKVHFTTWRSIHLPGLPSRTRRGRGGTDQHTAPGRRAQADPPAVLWNSASTRGRVVMGCRILTACRVKCSPWQTRVRKTNHPSLPLPGA